LSVKYTIKRINNHQESGVFGVFLIDNKPFCITCEETWLNNQPQVSCIPAGVYQVEKYSGTKYKDVWLVKNVPGRSAILIHNGNNEGNTAGCILVGKYFQDIEGKTNILGSVETLDRLRKILPRQFTLEIVDCF